MPELVQFPVTNLGNVADKLRDLANGIEAGKFDKVEAAFVVLPRDCDYPLIFGFGNVENSNHPIIQLELAKAWFINNVVKRC
jgi:hypothetical protein